MSSTLEIRAILRDEFTAAAQKLRAELLGIGATGASAGAALSSGMSTALPTVESVTESLGRQNAQLRAQIAAYKDPAGARYIEEQRKLRAELDKLDSAGKRQGITWTDLVSKYYMVTQGLGMAANATMAVVDASSKYDSIRVRLDAFEGSAQAGAAALERLQTLAKQPGLGLEQASSAYAGLRALKKDGPEAIAIIEAIAKANASMGGGAEEFGRAMFQIQQMLGKGKLMGEDINTISESIPNFRGLIMDAFGTTDTKALNAKYSVDELLKGIEEAAKKLPPPGETIKNNMDNIGDAWVRLKASMGDTQMIKDATSALAGFLERLATVNENDAKALAIIREMRGRAGNTWKDVLFGETEAEARNRYFKEGGRLENVELIGQTSGSQAATSYAASMTAPGKNTTKTDAQIEAEEKAAKAAAKIAEDHAQERIDAMNRAEQDRANREQRLRMQSGRPGHSLIWSDYSIKQDKAEDDKYWKDQEKAAREAEDNLEAMREDARKKNNANVKQQFKTYVEAEEKATKKAEEEWEARSRLAMHYADTLSSTMASAYTDIWVNGRDVFASLYDAFSEMITKMAIEMAAKATIFGALSLIPGMGGESGLLGGAGSFIFGARASGGAMFPGVAYNINERQGGELFRPASAGMVSPNYRGENSSGDTIHIHLSGGATQADADRIARTIQIQKRTRQTTVTRRG